MQSTSFPGPELLFDRPPEPGGADQPGHPWWLALGDEAVVEGQLTGPGVAADQQVMAPGYEAADCSAIATSCVPVSSS